MGRRSLMSVSLRKTPGLAALGILFTTAKSTARSRSPPLAATIMSVRARRSGVALEPRVFKRKASGISADALPWLHLSLIALFRDWPIEIERRYWMHDTGSEGLQLDY